MTLRCLMLILACSFFTQAALAQPRPPSLPPLPPRPELPRPPGLPGADEFSQPYQRRMRPGVESTASEEPAPQAAAPPSQSPLQYEPPRALTAGEKRLRDVVFGLVCVVPLGLAGVGLIALTRWKKPYLSGSLYARGLVMGALLVLASLFFAVAIMFRLLGLGELRDLWS